MSNQDVAYSPITLVKIDWGNDEVWRLSNQSGFVIYDDAEWFGNHDDYGIITTDVVLLDSAEEIPNSSLGLMVTGSLLAKLKEPDWKTAVITTYQGTRDISVNDSVEINTINSWKISTYSTSGGIGKNCTLTLKDKVLGGALDRGDAYTYNSVSHNALHNNLDKGLDFISGTTTTISTATGGTGTSVTVANSKTTDATLSLN